MNADEISRNLGMRPDISWTAGDRRNTPKGTPLSGRYERSYCCFRIKHSRSIEMIDLIKAFNKTLGKKRSFLKSFRKSGGSLEYFIGWFLREPDGEIFDVKLIEQLSQLGIRLAFDIYPIEMSK